MTAHTVVLGRGNPYQQYPGNLRLAQIIDEHRVAYNTSDRANKTVISKRIVELVKESNGRFLKKRRRSSTTRKQKTSSNKASTTTPIMASAAAAASSRSGDSVGSGNDEDPGGGGSVDLEDDDDDTAISDGSRGSQPPPPPSQHGPQEEEEEDDEDKVEGWIEVSDNVARNKVSHGFRNRRLGINKSPSASNASTSKSSSKSSATKKIKILQGHQTTNNMEASILSLPFSYNPIPSSTQGKRQRVSA